MARNFMGMMARSDVKKEHSFKDDLGWLITVQAGESGWTVLWADNSSSYKDVINTTDINFQEALAYLLSKGFAKLTSIEPRGGK